MGRRQRNEERTKRFQEHRVTRGVDVATLDTQVKDNQRKFSDILTGGEGDDAVLCHL